jgi:hypothetical protein
VREKSAAVAVIAQKVFLRNTATLATPGIPPHVPRFQAEIQAEMAARSANVGFTPCTRDLRKDGRFQVGKGFIELAGVPQMVAHNRGGSSSNERR